MKNAALRSCSLALGLALFGSISTRIEAVDAYTDPVGYYSLSIIGGSDNVISLPMIRDAVFSGTVGGAITATGFEALAGTNSPGWTPGQFQYREAPDPQPQGQTFYVEFTSGQLKGLFYKIDNNGTNSLSLDTEGDSLLDHDFSNLPDQKLVVGDSFKIRPYFRVRDVFEVSGAPVIDARPNAISGTDDILVPNYTAVGINKAPTLTIFYLAGQGWRSSASLTKDAGDFVFRPNESFILRRRNANNLTITNLGGVLMNRSISFIAGATPTSDNDIYFSLNRPAPVTLDDSGLRTADQTTSVIKDSPNAIARQDELYAFDDTPGMNRAPTAAYYYLAGQGWRKVNSGSTTVGTDVKLEPGKSYIIRKKAGNLGRDWVNDKNY